MVIFNRYFDSVDLLKWGVAAVAIAAIAVTAVWLGFWVVFLVVFGLCLTWGFYFDEESIGLGIVMNVMMPIVVFLGCLAVGADLDNYNGGALPYSWGPVFGTAGLIYFGFIALEIIGIVLGILFLIVLGVWQLIKKFIW